MLVYKYAAINDNSIMSLLNKYFYCSRPSQLNDPFDCHIPIKHDNRDEFIEKWLSINRSIPDALGENIDFPFYTVQDVKKAFNDGLFDEYVYRKMREKDTDFYHVFCVSSNGLNPMMWNNYANSYKGMCIAYKTKDFSNEEFCCYGLKVKPIKIEKWRYFTEDDSGIYLNLREVNYSDEPSRAYNCIASQHIFVGNYNDCIGEFVWDSLHRKSVDWEHEKEFRGIFCNNHSEFDNKLYYEDEVLDSITFGLYTDDAKINDIKKLVQKNYSNASDIKFFRITVDNSTKTLKRKSV